MMSPSRESWCLGAHVSDTSERNLFVTSSSHEFEHAKGGREGVSVIDVAIWTGCMRLPIPFVKTLSRYVLTLTLF